jgi:hypothetical protein
MISKEDIIKIARECGDGYSFDLNPCECSVEKLAKLVCEYDNNGVDIVMRVLRLESMQYQHNKGYEFVIKNMDRFVETLNSYIK